MSDVPLPTNPNAVAQHFKSWWIAYGAAVTAVGTALLPYAQQWISGHPKTAAVVGAISTIAGLLKKSPLGRSQ